jgi:hypothetical protein
VNTAEVRAALREELETRGYAVASDSHGLRSELYVVGDNDLARALFEFKATAIEACDTMYQGSWLEGMPPRFAVLPASEAGSAGAEMLEQVRIVPLFFEVRDGSVAFPDLERLLAERL